ncbi:MAG: redoxin domain-containing protein [Janthinobacterium lividum]
MLKAATLCALLSAAATAGAQTPRPCQIKGHISGLGNGPVVFVYEQHGHQHRDTVRAAGGRFAYTVPPTDDGTAHLKLVPGRFTTFWAEPGALTVAGALAAPGEIAVRGTPENDVLVQYNQQIGWPFERRRTAHPDSARALQKLAQRPTLAFVKAHPRARTSANLLYWQTVYDEQPIAAYELLLRGLAPAVQASAPGRKVAQRLVVLRNQPVVGRPAPAFTLPDTAGVAVPLSRFKGQLVLLDFWGHWCGPCVASMPHLKQVQARYARQLAVVGIGMEDADDKLAWQQAIRKYQANWTQLSELKGAEGVIAQYNVTEFPTYLLLDQQGVVVARANELGPIEATLKTLVPAP